MGQAIELLFQGPRHLGAGAQEDAHEGEARRVHIRRDMRVVIAVDQQDEKLCDVAQLQTLMSNPLFSFISAGRHRLPLLELSIDDAKDEIIDAKNELNLLFKCSFQPVFYQSSSCEKIRHDRLAAWMMEHGYQASISKQYGVCRPGDNMFRLRRLPLAQGVKSFEQFELQGLSDAIDEFLLVTLAQEREL